MICDFENGSRMLPLLSKISDSQGGGSILLPFLDCIFSQIFMRGGIYQDGGIQLRYVAPRLHSVIHLHVMKKNILLAAILYMICVIAHSQENSKIEWQSLSERLKVALKENKTEDALELFFLEGVHEDYPKILSQSLKRISKSDYLKIWAGNITEEEKEQIESGPMTTPLDPIGVINILLVENRPTEKDGFYVGLKDGRYYLLPLVPRAFVTQNHNQSGDGQ
jgi:hypothetical protein